MLIILLWLFAAGLQKLEKGYRVGYLQTSEGTGQGWPQSWKHVQHDRQLRQYMNSLQSGNVQSIRQFLERVKHHTMERGTVLSIARKEKRCHFQNTFLSLWMCYTMKKNFPIVPMWQIYKTRTWSIIWRFYTLPCIPKIIKHCMRIGLLFNDAHFFGNLSCRLFSTILKTINFFPHFSSFQ